MANRVLQSSSLFPIRRPLLFLALSQISLTFLAVLIASAQENAAPLTDDLDVNPRHIATDKAVRWDYDIVYVRAPRKGDGVGTNWPEIANPLFMDAGADLMLLHPDGREEVLVVGGMGSVTDPVVSLDGEWIYYSLFHNLKDASTSQGSASGADIFKVHVKTRKNVRLTEQRFTPNTGAAKWSRDFRTPEPGKNFLAYGVFNMSPCPLPDGKLAFTSNRNAFKPPKRLPHTLQLFVMDDPVGTEELAAGESGRNVTCIGHLNLGMALHPVTLTDGRIMFSSLESQGLRGSTLWGLWSIHPDGTNWGPLLSAFLPGESPTAFHFQTQLSDGSIVAEEYYNQTSSGFGSLVKFPPRVEAGRAPFGPAYTDDRRNPPLRHGRLADGGARLRRLPFSPAQIEAITTFARSDEGPADLSSRSQRRSKRVGRVTHPSAAPENHLLTIWSPGPVNGGYTVDIPAVHGGIYLIKAGKPVNAPGEMLLIKHDPKFNAQWPRAVVSYKRIYGIDEPARLPRLANNGTLSPHLPKGSPFGLIGTSSLYKRESYPNGAVLPGSVTATFSGGIDRTGGYRDLDPFNSADVGASFNWTNQGADAGQYANRDIHAIRILVMEPTTDRNGGPKSGRTFRSHANERLRILGEIPVRHFDAKGGQPLDPDGNPDTSFLAKIPADTAFTFQTLNKDGMVLNMSQTWHQLRPGEIRHDCGGCHAHSQQPTPFEKTAAAKPDYALFDLTRHTPLLTARSLDQSGKKWDEQNATGVRFDRAVKNVEYHRDIKPILDRSCIVCHTQNHREPAGNLVLDDNKTVKLPDADDVPGTYYRLTMDYAARFGHKPLTGAWHGLNASRYVRMFQSRRSLLIWKIYGQRLDGWTNDDFPTEMVPGKASTLAWKGKPIDNTERNRNRADIDFVPPMCPPPGGKHLALSDEEKRTFVRWIDLGCPIDLDFDSNNPTNRNYGWLLDDQRPTLCLFLDVTSAKRRIRVGMHDYDTGLDMKTFTVTADCAIDGAAPGQNIASKFKKVDEGIWEYSPSEMDPALTGTLTVSIQDRQGNVTRIVSPLRREK